MGPILQVGEELAEQGHDSKGSQSEQETGGRRRRHTWASGPPALQGGGRKTRARVKGSRSVDVDTGSDSDSSGYMDPADAIRPLN